MKKYWNLIYGMTLAIFTIFVLLKVFVLPSKGNGPMSRFSTS